MPANTVVGLDADGEERVASWSFETWQEEQGVANVGSVQRTPPWQLSRAEVFRRMRMGQLSARDLNSEGEYGARE